MRVAFIVQGLPGEGYHGGALTCWAIIRALIKAGHHVCVISLFDTTPANPYLASRAQQEAALRKAGAEVVVIEYAMDALSERATDGLAAKAGRWLRRLFDDSQSLAYMMPWVKLAPRVQDALSHRTYDVFVCYHFDALSAVAPLGLAPVMAAVGDLWHLPAYFRWRDKPFSLQKYTTQGMKTFLDGWLGRRAMASVLKAAHRVGAFAGHYADWLRSHGRPDTLYLRTPVPDVAGPDWKQLREEAQADQGQRYRVLIIGDLGTTSTSSGLRAVADHVLPRLMSEFGVEGFELRLVGGGKPPAVLLPRLEVPSVRFVGRVVPADPEFLAADVMLVPTDIPLGIRVRVITGWSFGCPMVAHRANAAGIPEMRSEENALLADTDGELADAVCRLLRDQALRSRLSIGGRSTFEQYFAESVAGQAFVEELERLAKSS